MEWHLAPHSTSPAWHLWVDPWWRVGFLGAAAASLAAFSAAIWATIFPLCLVVTLGPARIFAATLEVNSDLLGSRSAS